MPLNRAGFSLMELVVALVLSAFLALLAGRILSRAAAGVRTAAERQSASHALHTTVGALRGVLEGIDPSRNDLLAFGPSGLTARVVRGQSVVCDWVPGVAVARRGHGWWTSARDPVPGRDSLAVARSTPGEWLILPLHAPLLARPCPDGSPGLAFPGLDSLAGGSVGPGAPIRFFEPVEIRSYSSSGSQWAGIRLVATGEVIQPLAGPFGWPGLELEFRDGSGATPASPLLVRSVSFRIRSGTQRSHGVVTPRGLIR